MNTEKFKIKINKELSGSCLEDKFIILLAVKSKYYSNSILEAMKFMTDKGVEE